MMRIARDAAWKMRAFQVAGDVCGTAFAGILAILSVDLRKNPLSPPVGDGRCPGLHDLFPDLVQPLDHVS